MTHPTVGQRYRDDSDPDPAESDFTIINLPDDDPIAELDNGQWYNLDGPEGLIAKLEAGIVRPIDPEPTDRNERDLVRGYTYIYVFGQGVTKTGRFRGFSAFSDNWIVVGTTGDWSGEIVSFINLDSLSRITFP